MNVLNERLTPQAASLTSLLAILWGGNNIAIKFALMGFPPFALAAVRFVLGSAFILIWVFVSRVPIRMESGEKQGLFQLAFLFAVQIYLMNAGVHHTLAGRSTVIISTFPFFVALFAHLLLPGDNLSPLKIVGMTLSFLGVILIFAESFVLGDFQYLFGDLMVLVSGLLLGLRMVYTKRLTQGIHPGKLLLWQGALSIPAFLVLSLIFEGDHTYRLNSEVVFGILYQGLVIAGFGFMLHTILLKRYVASKLGVFHFATPVFGVVFSNILLGEAISMGLIGSMILVGVGITIVNYES